MNITREMFVDTKEISVDYSYLQPRIQMMNRSRIVFTVDCASKEAAKRLHSELTLAWLNVKKEEYDEETRN